MVDKEHNQDLEQHKEDIKRNEEDEFNDREDSGDDKSSTSNLWREEEVEGQLNFHTEWNLELKEYGWIWSLIRRA